MPVYFFVLDDVGHATGEQFPDDIAARQHAEIIATEIGRDQLGETKFISVWNDRARRVFCVPTKAT